MEWLIPWRIDDQDGWHLPLCPEALHSGHERREAAPAAASQLQGPGAARDESPADEPPP